MLRPYSLCLLLAVSLLIGAGAAYSQTTFATITGVVVDSSGSPVPNASITATNVETNVKTTTRSNETGNYTIAQLQDGTYSVPAQAAGFKELIVDRVVLGARDVRRVDVKLEIGTVDTRIEVHGGATLIETETARIADTKDAKTLASLPLNARALWPFLILSPGLPPQPDGV